MSLIRASATIGSLTLVSRLLGFVRDMMMATFLGAGMLSDAFLVAFKLPNFLRQFFAEGAFNAAFVPLYSGTLAAEGPEAARTLAEEIHAVLLPTLMALCVLGVIFMPELMVVLAPGFDKDPAKFALTVTLTRITFPYILFISLVCLQGGILNSVDRFAAVAATPILMNLCFIAAMLVLVPYTPTPAHALAIGVMLSGVSQYLWLLYFCRRLGVNPRLRWPRMTANVKRLLVLVGPAALGSSVVQINLVISVIIASWIPGAVSILYYGLRVEELPFGVIGIAVSTALLPMLSRQIREGKYDLAKHTQNRALELSLLFGLPATVALLVIPYPIIAVIYQHGAFKADATAKTFVTVMAYAAGLPPALAVKIFASIFFAHHNTKTPVRIAMMSVAINLALNLTLVWPLQYVGLALSISVASWVNAICLATQLHKRGLFVMDSMFRFRIKRIALASGVMGVGLWIAYAQIAGYFQSTLIIKIMSLTLLIVTGAGVYGAALIALKIAKPEELKAYFKRK
jgi:putative peptidoglycan lipid II flippase